VFTIAFVYDQLITDARTHRQDENNSGANRRQRQKIVKARHYFPQTGQHCYCSLRTFVFSELWNSINRMCNVTSHM